MKHSVSMIGSRGIPWQSGGVERVLAAVCPRLVRLGQRVRVYSAHGSDYKEPMWKGVELVRTPSIHHKYFDTLSRSFLATWKQIFDGGGEIVHYHAIGSATLAWIPRLFGKKVVVTIHALDWKRKKWNWFGSLFLRLGEWAACRLPHRTIAVSQEIKRHLEARYHADVIYIPNGAERRAPRPPDKILAFGLGRRNFILYLARLVPEKGCHILIDAYLALRDRAPFKLVIAGGAWHSEDYLALLKEKAKGHPGIIFTGEVNDEVLEELYSNCYAYVLPSEIEGMSLSLLDAMTLGSCVVTSDIPENADVIGEAGLLFRTGDPRDLAEKLRFLMENPEEAERYRALSAEKLGREYDWDRIAQHWLEVYDELHKL